MGNISILSYNNTSCCCTFYIFLSILLSLLTWRMTEHWIFIESLRAEDITSQKPRRAKAALIFRSDLPLESLNLVLCHRSNKRNSKSRKTRNAPLNSPVCVPWSTAQLNFLMTLLMSSARGPGSPISFIRPTLSLAACRGTDKWNGQRNRFTTLKFFPVE